MLAGLFPGQGSHTSDMRSFAERFAPELLRRCIAMVGEDPFVRVTESTRFAQPAICCVSLAALAAHERALAAEGAALQRAGAKDAATSRPIAYAGHSLGELAALVAGGGLAPQDALDLSVLRGALMAQSGEGEGGGGMLALLGASEQQCEQLAEQHGVVIANDNAPGQIVLAGDLSSLRDARSAARQQGLRAIELDVAGAFHSPAMADAVQPFREALEKVEVGALHTPVISGASAQPFADVRAELAEAIVRPVRWRSTMQTLLGLGASAFLDFGPGKVLCRLVARNAPGAQTVEPLQGAGGSVEGPAGGSVERGVGAGVAGADVEHATGGSVERAV